MPGQVIAHLVAFAEAEVTPAGTDPDQPTEGDSNTDQEDN